MPAPEDTGFNDWMVVWRRLGVNRHSETVVSDVPEEVECDWQEGVTPAVDATVQVAADVEGRSPVGWGDKVWHGRLQDLGGTDFEDEPDGIMTVARVEVAPDLKGREAAVTLSLTRHKASLPEEA